MEGCEEESLCREPGKQDDAQHAWSGCEHHEMLATGGGDVGGCFTIRLKDNTKSPFLEEKTESSCTT